MLLSDAKEFLRQEEEIMANTPRFSNDKPKAEKWTEAQKIAACPRNKGRGYGVKGNKAVEIIKTAFGQSLYVPHYCNLCEECHKAKAEEHKERMGAITNKAAYDTENGGHWRRKVVEEDKEAKALKKKISRNQDGRHVEYAAKKPGYNEVCTYVKNGTKNADDYGEEFDPEETNYEEIYKRNRERNKKFSVGKGFKKAPMPGGKETERIIMPGILVDEKDAEKAEKLVQRTNYIEKAETFEDALKAYYKQANIIIDELEKEGIEVMAVHHNYRNVEPDKFLQEWNEGRDYWQMLSGKEMSTNAPLPIKSSEAKVDKVPFDLRLHYPEK